MSEFFTKGMAQDELIEAIRHGNLPDSLKTIEQLGTAIRMLEHRWERPMSEVESGIINLLKDCKETIRKAHEAHWQEATR